MPRVQILLAFKSYLVHSVHLARFIFVHFVSDMEESKRQMYKDMKFIMQISRPSDNRWQYEVFAPQGALVKSYNFAIGEEFDSTTLDGRPILVSV